MASAYETPSCRMFHVQQMGEVTLVELVGAPLSERASYPYLRRDLLALAAHAECKKFLVNFRNVTRFTSELLGTMVQLWKQVNERGGAVRLCEMGKDLREAFRVTKLEGNVFCIYDNMADALREF